VTCEGDEKACQRLLAERLESPTAEPPRWKLALLQWAAVYPIITVMLVALGAALAPYPVPLRTLVLSGLLVPLMSFVVMPRVTRWARAWLLGPERKTATARVTAVEIVRSPSRSATTYDGVAP
jgi:antibiotic biosynthesis monooxygenase (ABM) superfamily enzyme